MGGRHSTEVAFALPTQQPRVRISVSAFPSFFWEIFLGKMFLMLLDRVNQRRCLEESGQRLENVDRTHLVLASGKLVLQKNRGHFDQPEVVSLHHVLGRSPPLLLTCQASSHRNGRVPLPDWRKREQSSCSTVVRLESWDWSHQHRNETKPHGNKTAKRTTTKDFIISIANLAWGWLQQNENHS